MSTGLPIHSLSMAEMRFLRASWLQSGRCARCFHNGRQYRAADQKKDEEVSPRRKKAIAITEELSALAQSSPKRERAPRKDNAQTSKQSAGLAEGLVYSQATQNTIEGSRSQAEKSEGDKRLKQEKSPSVEPSIDAGALIRQGLGSATIAGNGQHGVLADRLKQISRTRRLRKKVFASADSSSEDQQLELADTRAGNSKHEPAQKLVIDKLIAGQHDGNDLFQGKEKYKQTTLNEVARAMTLNPSYLSQDTARFVNKVRALLPAVARPRPGSAPALKQ